MNKNDEEILKTVISLLSNKAIKKLIVNKIEGELTKVTLLTKKYFELLAESEEDAE